MHDRYIIVGCCARSGSVFIRSVFLGCGLQVGHERPDVDGVVGWQQLITNSDSRRKAAKMAAGRPIVWLMQVRHPIPAIASMAALYGSGEWPMADETTFEIRIEATGSDEPLLSAIKLYYQLNSVGLETQWHLTYRVEAIDVEWPAIAALCGIPGVELPKPPRDINTRKGSADYMDLTWPQIHISHPQYGAAILDMARRWGYESVGYK